MKDLGFIQKCEKCKHNISFNEKDIIKEYSPIGYIIKYKIWGGGYMESGLFNNLETLVQYINKLVSPPINSNCLCSGDKIYDIVKMFEYKHYIICPNCGEKILLEKGHFKTNSKYYSGYVKYGWYGYYASKYFNECIEYDIDHNGEHNL